MVDTLKDWASRWWSVTTSEARPSPDPQKLTTVNELPIYREDLPKPTLVFVEEDPLPLQEEFATVRKAFNDQYAIVTERFKIIDKAATGATNATCRVVQYVESEWTVLPRAAAITVGGMAGFVFGLRRSAPRRFFYAGVGLVTMAAFCYPHETVDLVRTGMAHTRQSWESFKLSPEPPKKSKPDLSPPK